MNIQIIKEISIKLNKYCLPLIFNSFLNMLFSSILFAIIGRTSVETIASVEVIDGFFYTFIGILGVSTLAFNMSVSKVEIGTRDFYDYFKSIFSLNFVIGIVAVIFSMMFSGTVLNNFYNFEGKILEIGTIYASIQSISILLNLVIFSMSNLMKVRKMTKAIFYAGLISSIVQIIISYILVKMIKVDFSAIAISIGSISSLLIEVIAYVYILKDDFAHAFKIKSSKKLELFKKSIPLIFQEILEGSIFQILLIALISKIGYLTLSSYALTTKMTAIALTPMYVYCNALIIFVSEYMRKNKAHHLKILPIITMGITLIFYSIISLLFFIFKFQVVRLFSDIDEVMSFAIQITGFILFFSSFQIFFENTKYALQSLGHSNSVLKITFIINCISIVALYILSRTDFFSIYLIVLVIDCTYLALGIIFYALYFKNINKMI